MQELKNNEPRPKFTGSYKKKHVQQQQNFISSVSASVMHKTTKFEKKIVVGHPK